MKRQCPSQCSAPAIEGWTDVSTEGSADQASPFAIASACHDGSSSPAPTRFAIEGVRESDEYGDLVADDPLDATSSPPASSWWSPQGNAIDKTPPVSSPLSPQVLAELGLSFSMLYPTLEAHDYPIKASYIFTFAPKLVDFCIACLFC